MKQELVHLDVLRKWWKDITVPNPFQPGWVIPKKLMPSNDIVRSALEDAENRKFFFSTAFRRNGRPRSQTKLAAGAIEP